MDQGLAVLKDFDAEIGGVGLHKQGSMKLPGPYRALTYVHMILGNENPEQFTRFAVYVSCAHIEDVLKQMARLGFFDRLRADRLPLGTILRKVKKPMPPELYEDLRWLSDGVCNYAKHHFESYNDDEESLDAHLFALDEAIALYLIARALVVTLEEHFNLPRPL